MVVDLKRAFDVLVALQNDADAAALAEAGWGAGRTKSHLIYVTIGTGVGGGILFGGQLYRGAAHSVDLSASCFGVKITRSSSTCLLIAGGSAPTRK